MAGEELQEVKVLVPVDRVAQFYAMVGRWLLGPAEVEVAAEKHKPWSRDDYDFWSGDDLVLAKKVWSKLDPQGRSLFSVIMDRPERRVSSTELAEELNIAISQIRGMLGAPSKLCYGVGRRPAVESEAGPEGEWADYVMTPEAAALFREARDGK